MQIPRQAFHAMSGALLSVVLALGPGARVSEPGHEHGHHGMRGAVEQITLVDGQKWPTEESLRQGMATIGAAFDEHHARIHAGTETAAQYEALAATIEREVKSIVANCHLPAAADANLHFVLADLQHGAELMRGTVMGRTPHDGAALVHGALLAYGKFFDDPAAAAADHRPK